MAITRIIILLFYLPLTCYAQSIERKIAHIRQKYDLIAKGVKDNAYAIKSIKFDCPDYSAYGRLTFYSEGSILRMIELENEDGSHGGEIQRYFIWGGELIFCYVERSVWAFDADSNQDTIVNAGATIYKARTQEDVYENRYYFYKEKPIRCLRKNFRIYPQRENNPDTETVRNEAMECDTETIKWMYSKLLKLNSVIFKQTECPNEIVEILK